jgi:endonuclease I
MLHKCIKFTAHRAHAACVFYLLAQVLAPAVESAGYYTNAEGKSGTGLRLALHSILSNHTVIPYSSTRPDTSDALKVLDQDPASTNHVLLIYSRRSEPKTNFALTTGWNREHLWCNSYGLDDQEPAFSDLHNLRAIDATVNSSRGNKFYNLSNTNDLGYRNPGHAEAPLTTTDTMSWSPPDEMKGDIARALFYMAVRYTGDRTNEPALYLTDLTNQVSSATNLMGRLTTLLRWHLADPVDDRERLRNDRVDALYQHNRNPFVDRPEWVAAAFWPVLRVQRAAAQVTLLWPVEYSGAVLETSGGFGAAWVVVTNTPIVNLTTATVTLLGTASQGFFRLGLNR